MKFNLYRIELSNSIVTVSGVRKEENDHILEFIDSFDSETEAKDWIEKMRTDDDRYYYSQVRGHDFIILPIISIDWEGEYR